METKDSTLVTSTEDVKQEMCFMMHDSPNTLAKTEAPQCDERITMKTREALVSMLLEIDLEKCQHHAIRQGRNKVLRALKAAHCMLMASTL